MNAGTSRAASTDQLPDRAGPAPGWLVLALACLGQFMVVLDISIVNVALPSIRDDLGLGASGLQWVVNAYTLTFAGLLLLGGRAADLFGRRRVFLIGLGIFTAASLAGGFAQSGTTLIVARSLKGLGAAVLAPATLTIITTRFAEGSERARALGVWSAVSAAGTSAGVLLGGLLTDLISWRWIMFVNVPIGVVALAGAWRFLPESREAGARRHLDVLGALTITAALVVLVFAIVRTETYAWTSPQTVVLLTLAAALLVVFLLVESRFARAPLVPLRIFRSRSVAGGNVFMFVLFGSMFGALYLETLFMQEILGFTPLLAGVAFLPQTVMLAAGAQVTSRLVTRLGYRPLLIGGTIASASGLAWLSRITPESTFLADLLGPFLLIGVGMGLSVTPVTIAGTAGVSHEDAGLASGLLNASRTVGAAIGLAALAAVAAGRAAVVQTGDAATTAEALTAGYAGAIEVAAIALLAGGILAALIIPSPPREDAPQAEDEQTGLPDLSR